jgi:hypothetical protein
VISQTIAEPMGVVLALSDWQPLQDAHAERVDALTRGHRVRSGTQIPHPVEDFLFTYYSLRPAQLRRWYPGVGTALAGAQERAQWRFHRVLPGGAGDAVTVGLDLSAFRDAREALLSFTSRLLGSTMVAPAQFGCFGLHEWAMVYEDKDGERRHRNWPLRLGQDGTDEVVRGHQIRCTHYDAFRFFTPPARPLNLLQPNLDSREQLEQPGCLHAAMDIYKWAYKLIPVVPSDLLIDSFVLAKAVRELDMRASPYDLTDLGYAPVRIETPAGKAEYVAAQRDFSVAAQRLRAQLLGVIATVQGRPIHRREMQPVSGRNSVPDNSIPGTTRHRP